jgi:GST-like protein
MCHWGPGYDWFRQNCPKIHAIAERLYDEPIAKDVFARNFD